MIASVLRDLTKPSWSQSLELKEVQEKKDRSKSTNSKYKLKCKSALLNKKNKVEDKISIDLQVHEDSQSSNTKNKSTFLSLSGTKSSSHGIQRIHKEISEGLFETESKAILTHDCEDDNMYIFLVDFIESTLDTYKDTNEISLVDSEIQEAMVLKEINEKRKTKPSNNSFNSNIIDLQTVTYKTPKEKPIITNLDLTFQKKNKVLPKTQRTEIRTGSKKLKKSEFVNNMKLQLGLEVDKSYFQEPQSFFESLMLNMKNKKRAEKFNHSDMECVFNRRKSATKKIRNKK